MARGVIAISSKGEFRVERASENGCRGSSVTKTPAKTQFLSAAEVGGGGCLSHSHDRLLAVLDDCGALLLS